MPHALNVALFLLAGATAAIACAADLEGKPEEYTAAYKGPSGGTGTGTAGAGAGGTPGGGTVVVPRDPDCLQTVLMAKACASCHFPSSSFGGGLDLTGNELGKKLSATPAKYDLGGADTSACDKGALIIQADDPARSVLLLKVKNKQSCGSAMPLGTGLTGDDLKCIEEWVNSFSVSANQITLDQSSGVGGNNP